jgi:hypothetical protein
MSDGEVGLNEYVESETEEGIEDYIIEEIKKNKDKDEIVLDDEDIEIAKKNAEMLQKKKNDRKSVEYNKVVKKEKADKKGIFDIGLKKELIKEGVYFREEFFYQKEIDINHFCSDVTTSNLMSKVLKDIIQSVEKLGYPDHINTGYKIFNCYFLGCKYHNQKELKKIILSLQETF